MGIGPCSDDQPPNMACPSCHTAYYLMELLQGIPVYKQCPNCAQSLLVPITHVEPAKLCPNCGYHRFDFLMSEFGNVQCIRCKRRYLFGQTMQGCFTQRTFNPEDN